jgi:hypothetical protein
MLVHFVMLIEEKSLLFSGWPIPRTVSMGKMKKHAG